MTSPIQQLHRLKRPKLMIATARTAARRYDRNRDLIGILGHVPQNGPSIAALLRVEDTHDQARRSRATGYVPSAHLSVLIALMGEAQILQGRQKQDQTGRDTETVAQHRLNA